MKRSDCLVMISGEAPVGDKKYNLFDHPNLKYTPGYRSPRGLLHRFATPIPAPEGYTMPPGLYGASRHRIARLCSGADLPRNY